MAKRKPKPAPETAFVFNGELVWSYHGKVFRSTIEGACPLCGAAAIVKLPDELIDVQPDETTHVCHPGAGGCNQGFAKDGGSNG